MARIPQNEFLLLKEMEKNSIVKRDSYLSLKNSLVLPSVNDDSITAAHKAADVLREIFFTNKFNIMDVVVGERGYGPTTESDTHYRGRVMESVLGGSFDSKSQPDFRYGDLKMIETKTNHVLAQVMTCGIIFQAIDKHKGEYDIIENYEDSKFFQKMKQAIIMPYAKKGRQLGVIPESVFVFEASDPVWSKQLKEDWESIRDEMKTAIVSYKNNNTTRRASGICKSDSHGRRRPNGFLGIRSDCVVFTPKFFEIVSRHYTQNK
jgi:hypothetical protein